MKNPFRAQGAPPRSRSAPRALFNGFSPAQNCLIQIVNSDRAKPARSDGEHCADGNKVVDIAEYLFDLLRYLNVRKRTFGQENEDGGEYVV